MEMVPASGPGRGLQLGELGLTWADDGSAVTLPPPLVEHDLDTHLYVSHTWKHAAEQCAVIRSLLVTMMPSCTFRIADDNVLTHNVLTHSTDKKRRQEVEEAEQFVQRYLLEEKRM